MAEDWLTQPPVGKDRLILIGGSAGSIDVLLEVLPALRSPLSFALLIVLHRKNTADSTLADLFALKTRIPLKEVDDKETIRPGHIYLAPADYHLLIEQDQTFSLDDSEKVNHSRPSIDVTCESAADVYGRSLVGVLLSGANTDGTEGLNAIKQAGGQVVVQQPETALTAFMPQYAIEHVSVDEVLDVPALIRYLNAF